MTRFVATILPVSYLATWLFNRSGGSVVIVTLYHWSIDITESALVLPQAVGIRLLWLSTLVAAVLAIAIWSRDRGAPVVR